MSLLPFFVPSYNNFGLEMRPHDFGIAPPERSMIRTMYDLMDIDEGEHKAKVGKDGFKVRMDVQHFHPSEINVKAVDNCVVVEAKHEEKRDHHGYISRQFTRRYTLPSGFKTDDVVSSLSSDGILTIKAAPAEAIESKARQIQIQQTGPARVKANKNGDVDGDKKK